MLQSSSGQKWQLEHSVKTSASYCPSSKLVTDNLLFHLCRSQLKSHWNRMVWGQGCTHKMLLLVHSAAYCRRTPKPSLHRQPVKEDNTYIILQWYLARSRFIILNRLMSVNQWQTLVSANLTLTAGSDKTSLKAYLCPEEECTCTANTREVV